jgi:hypothetical protein
MMVAEAIGALANSAAAAKLNRLKRVLVFIVLGFAF